MFSLTVARSARPSFGSELTRPCQCIIKQVFSMMLRLGKDTRVLANLEFH